MENIKTTEYKCLQSEIAERGKILHNIINLSIILLFISLIIFIALIILNIPDNIFILYLLLLPPLFAFLIFNYQANGHTLEVALEYTQHLFEDSWRPFYMKKKKKYLLIAFAKVLPMLLPLLIPLCLYSRIGAYKPLFFFDIVLGFMVAANYLYKVEYSNEC